MKLENCLEDAASGAKNKLNGQKGQSRTWESAEISEILGNGWVESSYSL